MLTRLRSVRDVVVFLTRSEGTYLVAIGLSVAGLASLIQLPKIVAVVLLAVGALGSAWTLFSDTRNLYGRHNSWVFRPQLPIFMPPHVPSIPGLPDICWTDRGIIATDWDLCDELAESDPDTVWDPSRVYSLPPELKEVASCTLRKSTGARLKFNGKCVRLNTDLFASTLSDVDLYLETVSFFDLLCSNELAGSQITREGREWDTEFRENYLFDSQGCFSLLSQSELANVIGISTFALTSDDHLVLVRQSERSSASASLLAPSGSGSLEPKDVPPSRVNPLSRVLGNGAERELREECSLGTDAVIGSTPLGFGRWLDRGGKPEFFLLSALSISSGELRSNPVDHRDEHLWTHSVANFPFDVSSCASAFDHEDPFLPLGENAERLSTNASVPLFFGLLALSRRLAIRPDSLRSLRGIA